MNSLKLYLSCLAIALAATNVSVNTLHATLGESAGSVDADKDALAAERSSETVRKGYTVQEIHSPSVDVREYVSPEGIVFGIAWNGLIHPDLAQLLGSYAGEYSEALRKTGHRPGARSLRMMTDRLRIEQWGHMRDLHGRAYDPALIPPGVAADEIK